MKSIDTNLERTEQYLKTFNREKVIKYLVKDENPIIFDVGANDGVSASEFKKYWPNSIIHCFEPQKECWKDLDKLEKTYMDKSIIVNKCATGNISNKEAPFYTHDITTGQSGFNKINMESIDSIHLKKIKKNRNQFLDYNNSVNHERIVEIIRLDNYMVTNNINNISLLKIDTQGFEPEVLEGLGEKLCNIDIVITELMFYDYYDRCLSFSDIENYLLPANFKLYDISHISKNPMNGRTDWVDVIYLNNRVRKNIK